MDVLTSNTKSETICNINILMCIANAFPLNLLNTYTGGDYKNECITSELTFGGYIELVNANLHPIDLLYIMR